MGHMDGSEQEQIYNGGQAGIGCIGQYDQIVGDDVGLSPGSAGKTGAHEQLAIECI
jgi:hypothetical protein